MTIKFHANKIIVQSRQGAEIRASRPQGSLGLVGASVAIGAVVLTACGQTSATASPPLVPEPWEPSALLFDAGPVFEPNYQLLSEIIEDQPSGVRPSFDVEFGGMPAPVGEPNRGARPVPVSPVEFGGMPAPLGEPGTHPFDGALDPGPMDGPR